MEKKERKFLEKDSDVFASWNVNSGESGVSGSFGIGEFGSHMELYFFTEAGKKVDLTTVYKLQDMLDNFIETYEEQFKKIMSDNKDSNNKNSRFFGDLFMQRADEKAKKSEEKKTSKKATK